MDPRFHRKEEDGSTDYGNSENEEEEKGEIREEINKENDSDIEEVEETVFDNGFINKKSMDGNKVERSDDPFNIYEILEKRNSEGEKLINKDMSYEFPPGFTPNDIKAHELKKRDVAEVSTKESGCLFNDTDKVEMVMEVNSGFKSDLVGKGNSKKNEMVKSGVSFLQLMDELVEVGQAMGYDMEGVRKNIGLIIGNQGGDKVD